MSMHSSLSRREFLASAAARRVAGRLAGPAGGRGPGAGRGPSPASCSGWPAGRATSTRSTPSPTRPANIRGEFKPIDTSVPGIRISEHFPTLRQADAARRHPARHEHPGVGPQAGDVPPAHRLPEPGAARWRSPAWARSSPRSWASGTCRCRTSSRIGRGPQEAVERRLPRAGLPAADASTTRSAGSTSSSRPAPPEQFGRQVELLQQFEKAFHAGYRSAAGEAHRTAIDRAVRLMNSQQKQAFDLSREPDRGPRSVRPAGQRRRRPSRGGKMLSGGDGRQLRPGLPDGPPAGRGGRAVRGSGDGRRRRLGHAPRQLPAHPRPVAGVRRRDGRPRRRTSRAAGCSTRRWSSGWASSAARRSAPAAGATTGRGPGAACWSAAASRAARSIGRTDRDGAAVVDRPISVPDFLGTVCTILGIDYKRKNHPPGVDRPIPIVDTSKGVKAVSEVL